MKSNLKVILSAVGVAALLASPAMAQRAPRQPSTLPSDARGSVAPDWTNQTGPYTPSIPTFRYGKSQDFQGGGGDK